MKVLFDTNVFRDVQRGKISINEVHRAKALITTSHSDGCFSPLTMIEVGSNITDKRKTQFIKYRDTFRVILDLCQFALPDPEAFLCQHVFSYPPITPGISPKETVQISKFYADTESYAQLAQTRVVEWNGVQTRVSYIAGYLHRFRQDFEQQYIQDMHKQVVSLITPDYKAKRMQGKMARMEDIKLREQYLKFIDSDEFKKIFFKLQAVRVGIMLFGESPSWDQEAMDKMDAFFTSYCWILKKIAESGYNPEKNKNDFNDLHFLIYLADDNIVFITGDEGIGRKVSTMCSQGKRILTFKDWLSSSQIN